MRHASLFSGIGGFDLAAEWMGWENVFHCEWMEFPRKVLDYYWPGADSYTDICKTDFKKYANQIDILTGGFPCQPFSMAGKRKGTEDERYLWGEMLRAVQEIKPTYVIAENVFGITNIDGGLVFEQVCLDLEAEGYEVQSFVIPAAAKNAPHRRDRCWFVAFNTKSLRSARIGKVCTRQDNESIRVCGFNSTPIKNTLFSRCLYGEIEKKRAEVWQQRNTCSGSADRIHLSKGDVTNTQCSRGIQRSKNIQSEITNGFKFIRNGRKRNAIDTNRNGLNKRNGNNEVNTSQGGQYALGDIGESNDNGNTSNTNSIGQESRHDNNTSDISKTYGLKQFYGSTNWKEFPTQSPICGGDDGLPTELDGITFSKWRSESIKGYGNAIVPQVAYEIFKQL